ncbi:hypothetical protein NUSPORA_01109 [Nucleospora cyclopteri]
MVIKATERDIRPNPSKIQFKTIKTVSELKNIGVDSVIIKVSSPSCPPCNQLQQFLKDYECNKQIIVCCLDVSSPCELLDVIKTQYNLRSVPFMVHLKIPSLETIYTVQGFKDEEVETLLSNYNSTKK